MKSALAPLLLLLAAGAAHAGPTTRFGLTGAVEDQSAPKEHELGPTLAIGERIGPLMIEGDYAYLSFLDPDTGTHGMQRFGLNLRGDLLRTANYHCFRGMACTRGSTIYGEIGVAERFGQWHLDAHTRSPDNTDRQSEMHFGFGIELDNRVHPYRYGWQFGVRFAISPHDPLEDTACRGTTCTMPVTANAATGSSKSSGMDHAVLFEWTFLVGR